VPDRSLADQVCLTLVVQGASHGWAVGSLLARGAEVGRVWSLSRPLTYRALEGLAVDGFVVHAGTVPGGGRPRTLLRGTAKGRRASAAWLRTPVEHVRDVRTELLVKLVLLERAGDDPSALLAAQREVFEPLFAALDTPEVDDVVELWRRETARSVRRFLDAASASASASASAANTSGANPSAAVTGPGAPTAT